MPRKKKLDVHISFLLDRTGSMAPVKQDVIGGFNTFIKEQKKQPGSCRFTFTQFDSVSIDTETYDSIVDVPELSDDTYVPRSMTPLLDAMGRAISEVDALPGAGRTLFVVYTDGLENASREFTKEKVKGLVEDRQKNGWDFTFLGADIDAFAEAGGIGMSVMSSFPTSGKMSGQTLAAASQHVSSYRHGESYADSTVSLRAESDKQTKKKEKK